MDSIAESDKATWSHTVPALRVSRLIELVRRWQVSADALLAGSALTMRDLEDPLRRVPLSTMCALLERARRLTGEPGLAYHRGLQASASGFGIVGYASQAAPSLREALALASKLGPVFSTAITLEFRIEGKLGTLYFEENATFGSARDMVLITLMVEMQTLFIATTGRRDWGIVDLAIPEPSYHARFAHLVPRWRFGRCFNRIAFDSALLDIPLVTADCTGLSVVRALCERALDELEYDSGLVSAVRALTFADGVVRTLDEVADHLHISERTLKRRLAAQGASFSELTSRERCRQAFALLRSPRLSIPDIAARLGYSDESSFVRAFRRWTGSTPAAHRRERAAAAAESRSPQGWRALST